MTTSLSDAGVQFADNSILVNAPPGAIFRNLQLSSTGLSANVSITADELLLGSSGNSLINRRAFSATINTAATGKNGLSTGSLAASTWYAVWAGWDGTANCGWIDPSNTSPTVPTGVINYSRVGWIRTDASGSKYPLSFKQYGRNVQYVVAAGSNLAALPIPVSGAQGSISVPTWVSVSLANYCPTTASRVRLTLSSVGTSDNMAAPNNSYGAYSSATNPPPVATVAASGAVDVKQADFALESASIYYAGGAGTYIAVFGWEDNL